MYRTNFYIADRDPPSYISPPEEAHRFWWYNYKTNKAFSHRISTDHWDEAVMHYQISNYLNSIREIILG